MVKILDLIVWETSDKKQERIKGTEKASPIHTLFHISLQYSGMLSISLRFHAFRPTCFARRLVMRNLDETSTQRAR